MSYTWLQWGIGSLPSPFENPMSSAQAVQSAEVLDPPLRGEMAWAKQKRCGASTSPLPEELIRICGHG